MQKRNWMRAFYGFGALLVIAVLWFNTARPVLVLPRIRLSPGYALQNRAGETATSEDQRGKITVYTFAYTGCGPSCNELYGLLKALDDHFALAPLKLPLTFVTLTVDPERDTPETLNRFTLPYQPAGVDWTWMTGSEERMRSVVGGGFDVFFQPQDDGSVAFNPKIVLVDGFGVVRGEYDVSRASADLLDRDLHLIEAEALKATGVDRLAYEAAHFFACYPSH